MKDITDRIRIAIQKSGRLSDESLGLLTRCGIRMRPRKDQLFCHSDNFPLDILLVRDDDIPNLVQDGICDFGIVGTNVLQEKSLQTKDDALNRPIKVRYLDFGVCRLSIAVPENSNYQSKQDLEGCKIATSYPNLLNAFIQKIILKQLSPFLQAL